MLGRTDPLEIGAADQAAFDTLNAMLIPVDPAELIVRPPSPVCSSAAPSAAKMRPTSAAIRKDGAAGASSTFKLIRLGTPTCTVRTEREHRSYIHIAWRL